MTDCFSNPLRSRGGEFDQNPKLSRSQDQRKTTIALIYFPASGRQPTGGNIGLGVFDLDPAHDGEVIVLELSATKPSWRGRLRRLAVWTNISADHLDHQGVKAAKRRCLLRGPDRAVIGVDEVEAFWANQLSRADDRHYS